jgi:hypothetical protein
MSGIGPKSSYWRRWRRFSIPCDAAKQSPAWLVMLEIRLSACCRKMSSRRKTDMADRP